MVIVFNETVHYRFTLSTNPLLESLRMPAASKSAGFIVIGSNIKLLEIDFGGVERVNRLFVDGSFFLERVELHALAEVGELRVRGNRLLSPAGFDGLGTFVAALENDATSEP